MSKRILVVDDNKLECKVIENILVKDYSVVSVSSGQEALEVMTKEYKIISAIILDIVMPNMNGLEVLKIIRSYDIYDQIPIIIVTVQDDTKTELLSLELGATCFLSKPIDQKILTNSLKNIINLRETSNMVNIVWKDRLTGLFNREAFLLEAEKIIKDKEEGYYTLSCLDIANFKIINEQYGLNKGDEVLKYVGKCLEETALLFNGIACRFMADNFAIIFPTKYIDSDELNELIKKTLTPTCLRQKIRIRIGRYLVNDLTIPVSLMFDRASLAEESVRDNHDTFIGMFNNSMMDNLINEQKIVDAMDNALDNGDFIPYFQPQYNHLTGALIGAEALVRWKKGDGFISPAEFIGIFEKNGFIYQMDQYIWEEVCKIIRRWLDMGMEPLPISINISRIDFLHIHFLEVITEIVNKYQIPYKYIRLEVTESAFAEISGTITDKVNQLINMGFTVEIDDFGSGYSSLNTLKDVKAQIIKLDMRFFQNTKYTDRSGNIIESVVRMARWLGMAVIAEGVETKDYADYLKSIGCYYIQGYFYAKPMPVEEYEKLFINSQKEEKLTKIETVNYLDNNDFWNPKSFDSLIFNSYVGGACIFEYKNGVVELLRINEQYNIELGVFSDNDIVLNENMMDKYHDEKNRKIIFNNIRNAIETKKESTCEIKLYNFNNPSECEYIRSTVRAIANIDDRHLLYCVIVNITNLKLAEQKEKNVANRLKAIMDSSKSGITASIINKNKEVEVLFVNNRFYEMVGYEKENYPSNINNCFERFNNDDYNKTVEKLYELNKEGLTASIIVKVKKGDGSFIWLKNDVTTFRLDDVNELVYLSSFIDITEQTLAQEKERQAYEQLHILMRNLQGGVTAITIENGKPKLIIENNTFYEQRGYTKEQYENEVDDIFSPIVPEEREIIRVAFKERFCEDKYTLEYHIKTRDGLIKCIKASMTSIHLEGIEEKVQLCIYNDISDLRFVEQKYRESTSQLNAILDNIASGICVLELVPNNPRLIFANSRFYKIFDIEPNFEYRDVLSKIHRDDQRKLKKINAYSLNKKTETFRFINNDTSISWINTVVSVSKIDGIKYPVQLYIFTDVTDEHKNLENVKYSEEEYRLATYLSGNIIGRYNIKNQTLVLPKDIAKKYSLSEVLEGVPYEIVRLGKISTSTAEQYINFFEAIIDGKKEGKAVFERFLLDNWRTISAHYYTIFDEHNVPVSAVISFNDITEEMEKELIYAKWKNSLKNKKQDTYTILCCDLDKEHPFDFMSGKLLDFDFNSSNMSFDEIIVNYANNYVYIDDREAYINSMKSDKLIADYDKGIYSSEFEYRELINNNERWLSRTIEVVKRDSSSGLLVYIMYESIDSRIENEQKVRDLIEKEPLTGLYNRKAFIEKLEERIRENDSTSMGALLFIDIDEFKNLNDTLGHLAGDEELINIANKLKNNVRKTDLISRFGGDEFIIYIDGIGDINTLSERADKICKLLYKKISDNITLSATIGIALYPLNGATFTQLYTKADRALYQAKKEGKNRYKLFNDKIN